MQFKLAPLDLLNLLFLPLMVTSFKEIYQQRASLFDDDLTLRDRYLLQRLVIFLLLPTVVFLHELGHVMAIKQCGGQIQEFHYAFMWGYVVPQGNFSPEQTVWMYLSGNLVQIVIGLLALLGATIASSPPAVALLVYLGLWAIGGTVVIYTFLSFTGVYGDWLAIYSIAKGNLWLAIFSVHIMLVVFVFWMLYASAPRIWFISRTQPQWLQEQKQLWSAAKTHPTASNWLNLGWSYVLVGLLNKAQQCLKKAQLLDAQIPESTLLESSILVKRGLQRQAIACLDHLLQTADVPAHISYRALLALADCQIKTNQPHQALETYQQAISLEPDLADPVYLHALVLNNLGQKPQALAELMSCMNLQWRDVELKELAWQSWQQIRPQLP